MHAEGHPNLKPNKKGRPSRLDEPGFMREVAELFAAGKSRREMCEELDVADRDTITRWRKDPRIRALVARLIEDRAIQVSRKIDSVIEGRLSQAENMTIDELIKIRKEFGGATVKGREIADDTTVEQAWEAVAENPKLAQELEELFEQHQQQAGRRESVED